MRQGPAFVLGGGLLIVAACAYYTRPTQDICFPRQTITQAVGRVNAIYDQITTLQIVACREGRMPPADCAKADAVRQELRAAQRDAQAAVMTPGYEFDWTAMMRTLDGVGRVLDLLPVP